MFTLAKTVSLLVIFFLSFLSGVISCVAVFCLQRKYGISGRFQRIKSLLTCFSGGVFFATSITTLLPEAREKMEEVYEMWDFDSEYPLSELLVGVGFLLILTFENLSHLCCSAHNSNTASKESKRYYYENESHSKVPENAIVCTKFMTVNTMDFEGSDKVRLNVAAKRSTNIEKYTVISNDQTFDTKPENKGDKTKPTVDEAIDESKSNFHRTNVDLYGSHRLNGEISGFKIGEQSNVDALVSKTADLDNNSHQNKSKIRGLVLLIALSLHMVFDGLAIGLLEEDKKVWTLILALSIHKVLVFLSVGIETFELMKSLPKSVLVMFFFALVSPIGIAIGVAVTESEDELAQSVASAVLQSIATGTFIYVTFFEILQKEYEGGPPGMTKVLFTVVGFALIAGVKVLEGVDFY